MDIVKHLRGVPESMRTTTEQKALNEIDRLRFDLATMTARRDELRSDLAAMTAERDAAQREADDHWKVMEECSVRLHVATGVNDRTRLVDVTDEAVGQLTTGRGRVQNKLVAAMTAERDRGRACLDDYQARFVALHNAWATGDNATCLDALRRHVKADDDEGKNAVLLERDASQKRESELRKLLGDAREIIEQGIELDPDGHMHTGECNNCRAIDWTNRINKALAAVHIHTPANASKESLAAGKIEDPGHGVVVPERARTEDTGLVRESSSVPGSTKRIEDRVVMEWSGEHGRFRIVTKPHTLVQIWDTRWRVVSGNERRQALWSLAEHLVRTSARTGSTSDDQAGDKP